MIEKCVEAPAFTSDVSNRSRIESQDQNGFTTSYGSSNNDLQLTVYPNPISNGDLVNIHIGSKKEEALLKIQNLDGKRVVAMNVKRKDFDRISISTRELTSGTYLIYVKTGTELKVEKMIILK